MSQEEAYDDGLSFLGRSPFGQWSPFHDLLAERTKGFLAPFAPSDRREFEQKLEAFLLRRAQTLGCRKIGARQCRWIMPKGSSSALISDVQLFATSFQEGEGWDELQSFMREIRPLIRTEPKPKRAARSYDGEALQTADSILSSQAGALWILGWRGADVFENEDRLRAQVAKAAAARKAQAAAEREPIRDQLARVRAGGAPRRGAAKRAAAELQKTNPDYKAVKFDTLVHRCRVVLSEDFADWISAKPSSKEKKKDP